MKESALIMGMPVSVEIEDAHVAAEDFSAVFDYLNAVEERFSVYKETSEISKINRGELSAEEYSDEMEEVFRLCEKTKMESMGFFNIKKADGTLDPSGVVKGWAVYNAAKLLRSRGLKVFFVDVGGDIQAEGKVWKIGIRNPFKEGEIIKVVYLKDKGIATSGTYVRGQHIYNPFDYGKPQVDVVSLSVIGDNVFEADRFATPAFAMGEEGIYFIEKIPGLEGYQIDGNGMAKMTTGFEKYTKEIK